MSLLSADYVTLRPQWNDSPLLPPLAPTAGRYGGLREGLTPADSYRQIIGAVSDLSVNDADPYGDGDQSFVDDETATGNMTSAGQNLRSIWGSVQV